MTPDTTTASGTLPELFAEIHRARERDLLRNQGPWPRSQPIASDLFPCAREQALAILHWAEKPQFAPALLARFEAGSDKESPVLRRLEAYGFPVVEQQRTFELKGRSGAVVMRGRIDGKVQWAGRRYPFDLKTVDPLIFPKLNTLADLQAHPFFSKWPRQIMAYCYLDNTETGFLLLENLKGAWKFIEVPLDYAAMEQIVSDCEAAVAAVTRVQRDRVPEAEALPPFTTQASLCGRCWALGRFCQPPGVHGPGAVILDNVELAATLDRRAELEAAHHEYETLDRQAKAAVRGQALAIAGDWLIRGEMRTVHYEAAAARQVEQWVTNFERLTPRPAVSE